MSTGTRPPDAPKTIGVAGAGTMGAGIAQLACQAGALTLLYDPVPEALASGVESVTRGGGTMEVLSEETDQGVTEQRFDLRVDGDTLERPHTKFS